MCNCDKYVNEHEELEKAIAEYALINFKENLYYKENKCCETISFYFCYYKDDNLHKSELVIKSTNINLKYLKENIKKIEKTEEEQFIFMTINSDFFSTMMAFKDLKINKEIDKILGE